MGSPRRVMYAVPSALLLLLNEIHVNVCSQKNIAWRNDQNAFICLEKGPKCF
jgi:hypothetical protein